MKNTIYLRRKNKVIINPGTAHLSKNYILTITTGAQLASYFKTATDILRLITALSDGDVSLAQNTKYRTFQRYERRFLLDLLEHCPVITEDMLRHKKNGSGWEKNFTPLNIKSVFPNATRHLTSFVTTNLFLPLIIKLKRVCPRIIYEKWFLC